MKKLDVPSHDQDALLDRLSHGIRRGNQEVVFVVGAAFSAPTTEGLPGVPPVAGVIDLIRSEFQADATQLRLFDDALSEAGRRRYQAAFQFLQGRRGQDVVNEVVRRAVMLARALPSTKTVSTVSTRSDIEDLCRFMEGDTAGWGLTPATETLGKLAVGYPQQFGRWILTTNFDPLIEIAIRRAGGTHLKTVLQSDGDFTQTEGDGCHVVHLHGYWYGSDTLHTARQLSQSRPRLESSLRFLLKNKVVVVCGYGGWDDAFTAALMDVVRDDSANPEILWTLHSGIETLDADLLSILEPGIDRGRVNLYAPVDCHRFLPELYAKWSSIEPESERAPIPQSNPVHIADRIRAEIADRRANQAVIEGDDEDRPPVVDICVGRESELKMISTSNARVIFITGIGGEGKSTLAARYFAEAQKNHTYNYYVWRDCKEEGERFENQLASVIEKLSLGRLSGTDLAKQSIGDLVDVLGTLILQTRVLFVFDNVDHYVDLDSAKMVGSVDAFLVSLLTGTTNSRAVFTCRPSLNYAEPVLTCHLTGINLDAAVRLFEERGAPSSPAEIDDAHRLTNGHAFWLDLLAIQTAKPGSEVRLSDLVNEIRSGGGPLPEKTLRSIWATLRGREQTVLRAMAETLKPTSEAELGDYLRHEINYHKVLKALKTLRDLNLIVVKRRSSAPDVLELHPMVRRFVRQYFPPNERASFIDAIIRVYKSFIGLHKGQLEHRPTLKILQYWTENAELDIAAGNIKDAYLTLSEVANAFASSAYPREFCRVARMLLAASDWVSEHARYGGFETVFDIHLDLLSHLGEDSEIDNLLERYERTVPNRDVRYIHYCAMRAHSKWTRGDFSAAVEWGRVGEKLLSTGVDTSHELYHTLALAQRDAGHPELALPTFLYGSTLAEAVDSEELDENRGGAYYGNIGRCLHFMGQTDAALICYQKSAVLIERDPRNSHNLNQGYIRAWIGELLASRGQLRLAQIFLQAAYNKWEEIAPPKASKVLVLWNQLRAGAPKTAELPPEEAEAVCLDWILGHSLDAEFQETAPGPLPHLKSAKA